MAQQEPDSIVARLTTLELTTLLIRAAGQTEGVFYLAANFLTVLGNMNFPPNPTLPTIASQFAGVELHREVLGKVAPAGMGVNAAHVNPKEMEH